MDDPASIAIRLCSTPFGINERGTIGFSPPFAEADMCSTPFGINERGTRRTSAISRALGDECSTPFGINERGTFRYPGAISRHSVLNAFRHQ